MSTVKDFCSMRNQNNPCYLQSVNTPGSIACLEAAHRTCVDTILKGIGRFNKLMAAVLFVTLLALCGCADLVPRDTSSLFIPRLHRSEIFGFLAGLGTTCAAVPDLIAMLK